MFFFGYACKYAYVMQTFPVSLMNKSLKKTQMVQEKKLYNLKANDKLNGVKH